MHFAKAITELSQAGAGVIVLDVPIIEESADTDADNALFEAVAGAEPPVIMTTPEAEDGETLIFGGGEGLEASGALAASSVLRVETDDAVRRMGQAEDGLRTVSFLAAETKLGRAVKPPVREPRIAFPGPPGTVAHISLADVESGEFKPETVRGKVALIGVNGEYAHTIGDTYDTPAGTGMAGPEIRAASIATALAGFPLRDAPAWAVWVAIVVLALIPPLFALRWGPFVALFAGFVAAALYLVFAQLAFNNDRIVVVIPPLAAVVTSMVATASLVHGDRPAWLDRLPGLRQPFARRQHPHAAAAGAAAADRGVRRRGDPAVPRGHGCAQARRPGHDRRPLQRARRPGAAAGRRAGRASTTSRSSSSSVQWPFPRRYHAKVIDRAEGRRGARDRLRRPVHRAERRADRGGHQERQRADPSRQNAGNVVLSTTEVGAGGTTRVLGGGEALKASRRHGRQHELL